MAPALADGNATGTSGGFFSVAAVGYDVANISRPEVVAHLDVVLGVPKFVIKQRVQLMRGQGTLVAGVANEHVGELTLQNLFGQEKIAKTGAEQ